MNKKKILSFITSAVMATGFLSAMPKTEIFEPLTAEAESYGDYLHYKKVDEAGDGTYDCVEIILNEQSVESLDIPDEIDGLPVTSIGDCAFSRCESLTSITIPDSVTSIGYSAFYDCDGLTSINVSESNENYSSIDGVLFNKKQTELIQYLICNEKKEYVIPDGVTSIVGYAFYNCDSLTSITIPDSVTSIGEYAFYGCNKLSQIAIPATVKTIGKKALGYSSSGEKISSFKIYGTAAETYALENGFTFIDIENTPFISETELALNVGDSFVLEVKNYDGEIVWCSNDSAIATVKDGYVSAVAEGETVVYAIIGESVLKCNVTVNPEGTVITTAATTTTGKTTSTTTTKTSVSTTEPKTTNTIADNSGATNTTASTVTTVTTTTATGTTRPTGDANGDDKMTVSDAAFIARTLAKRITISIDENPYADYNGDGKVTVADAAGIARELAKAKK